MSGYNWSTISYLDPSTKILEAKNTIESSTRLFSSLFSYSLPQLIKNDMLLLCIIFIGMISFT